MSNDLIQKNAELGRFLLCERYTLQPVKNSLFIAEGQNLKRGAVVDVKGVLVGTNNSLMPYAVLENDCDTRAKGAFASVFVKGEFNIDKLFFADGLSKNDLDNIVYNGSGIGLVFKPYDYAADFSPSMVPEEGSFNPVTSDGLFKAIDEAKEDMQEKIDEVTLDPSAVALGNVHLLDEVTELPADGCILIDSETNGPREMSKDTLLELTAQNALGGIKNLSTKYNGFMALDDADGTGKMDVDTIFNNFAPEFVPSDRPNPTTTIAGMPYVYEGSLYVAKVSNYQGPWDVSKFERKSASEIFVHGSDVQGAVDEWLEAHPEATTTVEDNSVTDDKLHPTIKFNQSASLNNYGRKVIDPNKSLLSQFDATKTIYEIRDGFDLEGNQIEIPANCILKFNGGKFYNGNVVGNKTRIDYNSGVCFGNDITITGSWDVPIIYSTMIESCETNNALKKLFALCNDDVDNEVYIMKTSSDYVFTPIVNDDYLVNIGSNTIVHNAAKIRIAPNGYNNYDIITSANAENILFEGGEIVGDVDEHDYSSGTTHEWGHCLTIWNCENVVVRNIKIKNATGDGLGLCGNNICASNLNISHCGRQGISIFYGENIIVNNFVIDDIFRTMPKRAIDIEPNLGEGTEQCINVSISNGVISDCLGFQVIRSENVSVKNITAKGCAAIMLVGDDTNMTRMENINCSDFATASGEYMFYGTKKAKNIYFSKILCDVASEETDSVKARIFGLYCRDGVAEFEDCYFSGRQFGIVNGAKFKNCTMKSVNAVIPAVGIVAGMDNKQNVSFIGCEIEGPVYLWGDGNSLEGCKVTMPSTYTPSVFTPNSFIEFDASSTIDGFVIKDTEFINNYASTEYICKNVRGNIIFERVKLTATQKLRWLNSNQSSVQTTYYFTDCSFKFDDFKYGNFSTDGTYRKTYVNGISISDYRSIEDYITLNGDNKDWLLNQSLFADVKGAINLGGTTITLKSGMILNISGTISNGTIALNGARILPSLDVLNGITTTGNPAIGTMRYDSVNDKYTMYNGSSWVNLDGTALS